jgi:hypothetical protein
MSERTRAGVVAFLLAGVTSTLAGEPTGGAEGPAAVVVHLSDYARLPPDVLGKSVLLARAALHRAGVATEWVTSRSAGGSPPRDEKTGGATDLTLELFGRGQSRALARSSDVLGVALLPVHEGDSLYAVVFVEKAAALAGPGVVPLDVVIGHAMAHEIAHLLLGNREHSAMGLMRSQWSSEELQRAAQGQLRFSGSESMRLQRAVAGSSGKAPPESTW